MMYGTQEFSVGMLPGYAIKQETTQSLLSCPYSDNTIWEADFPGRDVLVMFGITNTTES